MKERAKTPSTSLTPSPGTLLTAEQFRRLSDVPAALEWLGNIPNARTRRNYERHATEFARFVGIKHPDQFREVTRAHVIEHRRRIERDGNSPATIRAKLAALSSLFDYLCEQNSITHNPVKGVKRPKANNNEGKTPAISDAEARRLLSAPATETLKGKRDRAIVATFLYQMVRREELCNLRIGDLHLTARNALPPRPRQRRTHPQHRRPSGRGRTYSRVP